MTDHSPLPPAPWPPTARRIVGTSILVCSLAAVIIYAIAACILFISLYE
jgi:hypothetical protein